MAEHPLPKAWRLRIIAATRDLIEDCGGVERCGVLLGVHAGTVSRWQRDIDIIPLLSAMVLEADCGRPYVTKILADFTGHEVTKVADAGQGTVDVLDQHNEVMRRFVDVTHAVVEARSDGQISPADAEIVDRETAELIRAADDLRDGLAAHRAGASSNVTKIRS